MKGFFALINFNKIIESDRYLGTSQNMSTNVTCDGTLPVYSLRARPYVVIKEVLKSLEKVCQNKKKSLQKVS